MKLLSCVQLFATPWTVAHQAPPSVEFSRQEYQSQLPFPSPRDLPDPGIEPGSPALQTTLYHLSLQVKWALNPIRWAKELMLLKLGAEEDS